MDALMKLVSDSHKATAGMAPAATSQVGTSDSTTRHTSSP